MYDFIYRRRFWPFKTVLRRVNAHCYDRVTDKMWVQFVDGTAREILRWKECEAELGPDWCLASDTFNRKVGKPAIAQGGSN